MTALADKLEKAGVDVLGARLTAAATIALQHHPESPFDAWREVGVIFGYDFLRDLLRDMQGKTSTKEPPARPTQLAKDNQNVTTRPYQPRQVLKIEPARAARAAAKAHADLSKYRCHDGRNWSEVGAHELKAMERQGSEANSLRLAIPANVPNDGRTLGDILGAKEINRIVEETRSFQKFKESAMGGSAK